jgi:hypothetical protein
MKLNLCLALKLISGATTEKHPAQCAVDYFQEKAAPRTVVA